MTAEKAAMAMHNFGGTAGPVLDPKSLKELVAEAIRHSIVEGRYMPGHQLKQDSLAREFGVSRMPIREALLQLEAEGLVEFRRHRVAVVRALSSDDIREIFEIRTLLECRAVELGVPRMSEEDLREMAACHNAMSAMKRWTPEWPAYNKRFHSLIYNAAGRVHMVELIASVQSKLDLYLTLYLSRRESLAKSHSEHADILEACQHRDAKRAATLTEQHILETMESLLSRYAGPMVPDRKAQPEPHVSPINAGRRAAAVMPGLDDESGA